MTDIQASGRDEAATPANDHLLDKSAPPGVKAPAAESSQADGKPAPSPAVLSLLWTQIREHKVVQWTLGYLALAYTLLHGAEMLSEAFDWPHFVVRVFTVVLIVGVPVAAVLAWYHGSRAQRRVSGMEMTILGVLLLMGGTLLWNTWKQPDRRAAEPAAAIASVAGLPPEQ
jgi:hypothetical protein